MAKKLTQEEILCRFYNRWGDRYDYSNVKYINRRTPIIVKCSIHGDFKILPLSHADGHGCPKCGNIEQAKKISKPRYDKKELLRRLYEVHSNDNFDYSLIEDDSFVYKGTKTRIPVICNDCGNIIMPIASDHLAGCGCNICRLKKFSKAYLGKYKPSSKRKLVSNVGVIDVEYALTNDKTYTVWREMIGRCYNERTISKRPTYKDCSVCEEWKTYSNYLKWYNEHYVDGFDVDKDLLSYALDRKVYSPETCCFLPKEINSLLSIKHTKRSLPVGVYIISGCVTAKCGEKYLGTYPTIEDARIAYLKCKKERIIELANKWKDKIEPNVYDALINLDVDKFFNNK